MVSALGSGRVVSTARAIFLPVQSLNNLAEIKSSTSRYLATLLLPSFVLAQANPALSLVVWTLKREVRAIRGCLGMYRR